MSAPHSPERERALGPASPPPDPRRYRRLRRFVFAVFFHIVCWDVLFALPLLSRFRPAPIPRWARLARRYRELAVELGGLLIKIGQFLSARIDLLPREVLSELAQLQDEVPPAPFAAIVQAIEADFGRPLAEIFAEVSPEVLGAASLAQVHPARLLTGEAVVVKVLRPGIEQLVETDLAAHRLALRLLRFSKTVRRRVDLDRLSDEVDRVIRAELDLVSEGKNAERFAELFAADPEVRAPRIYWQASAHRTLAAENVGAEKIGDVAALRAAGVDPSAVARALLRVYLDQIFVHSFVHADPHPGNLFVEPRGDGGFRLVFVDFGMVATVPTALRESLQEMAIAFALRDAARMVRAIDAAGLLLPGADLKRLEEIHRDLFARFAGVSAGQLRDAAFAEAGYFFANYRDLLYELPFQVQVDLLFVSRAVGLLAGLATQLDPALDPFEEILPFAARLAQNGARGWGATLEALFAEGKRQALVALGLPARIDRFLSLAEGDGHRVKASFAPEADRRLERLERASRKLGAAALAGALLIAAPLYDLARPESRGFEICLAAAALVLAWAALRRR